jgi:hypothetical protein
LILSCGRLRLGAARTHFELRVVGDAVDRAAHDRNRCGAAAVAPQGPSANPTAGITTASTRPTCSNLVVTGGLNNCQDHEHRISSFRISTRVSFSAGRGNPRILFRRRDLELLGPFSSRIAPALPMLILRNQVTRFRYITIGILQILPADARLGSRHALSVTSAATLWARHIIGIDHGRATPSTGHRSGSYPPTRASNNRRRRAPRPRRR